MSSNTTRYRLFNAASIMPSRESAVSPAGEEQPLGDEFAAAQGTEGPPPGEAPTAEAVKEKL